MTGATQTGAPTQVVRSFIQQCKSFSGRERNCCFLNVGGRRFANISAVSGLDFDDDGRAIGIVDWDFDGDLDVWMVNRSGPQIRYLRNDLPPEASGQFLALKLQGTTCNRDAIGARVEVHLKDQAVPLLKTLRAGEGFLSQSSKWLHFGLGATGQVARVVVRWPGGKPQTFTGLEAGHWYRVVQGRDQAEPWTPPPRSADLQPTPLPLEPASEPRRVFLSEPVPLPRLEFKLLDSQTGAPPSSVASSYLSHLQGKPALVCLWASWCEPCVAELRELSERRSELAAKGLTALALSLDGLYDKRSSPQDAAKLLDRLQFGLPAGTAGAGLLDTLQLVQDELFDRQLPLGLPCSFLIDAEGRLAAIYRGRLDVATVLDDVGRLALIGEERQPAALPFSGRWLALPTPRHLIPIALKLTQQGQLAEAWEYVSRHKSNIRQGAEYPDLLLALGRGLAQRGAAKGALEALHEAVELSPQSAAAQYTLAVALVDLKDDVAQAVPHLQQAAKLDAKHTGIRQTLAWVLATSNDRSQRNPAEALRWAKEAVALAAEDDPAPLDTLAVAHAAAGEFSQALELEERALKLARSGSRRDIVPLLQSRIESFQNKRPTTARAPIILSESP